MPNYTTTTQLATVAITIPVLGSAATLKSLITVADLPPETAFGNVAQITLNPKQTDDATDRAAVKYGNFKADGTTELLEGSVAAGVQKDFDVSDAGKLLLSSTDASTVPAIVELHLDG